MVCSINLYPDQSVFPPGSPDSGQSLISAVAQIKAEIDDTIREAMQILSELKGLLSSPVPPSAGTLNGIIDKIEGIKDKNDALVNQLQETIVEQNDKTLVEKFTLPAPLFQELKDECTKLTKKVTDEIESLKEQSKVLDDLLKLVKTMSSSPSLDQAKTQLNDLIAHLAHLVTSQENSSQTVAIWPQ